MTRKKILIGVKELITNTDVVFCIGSSLCKESPMYNEGTLYINNDYIDMFAVALGVAMSTDKRVIVVAEDAYFLRYFNSILQASVSKCMNLFFIILVTELYDYTVKQNTITKAFRSIKGMLFNTGMMTHEYSVYFSNKNSIRTLKNIILNTIGPAVGLVNITSNRIYSKEEPKKLDLTNIISFIRNKELKTSMRKVQNKPFDLDVIMKEG